MPRICKRHLKNTPVFLTLVYHPVLPTEFFLHQNSEELFLLQSVKVNELIMLYKSESLPNYMCGRRYIAQVVLKVEKNNGLLGKQKIAFRSINISFAAFAAAAVPYTTLQLHHHIGSMICSVTRCNKSPRLIALWATFQSLWQQLFCPNFPHFREFL